MSSSQAAVARRRGAHFRVMALAGCAALLAGCNTVQEVTGKRVEVAFADQGYTGEAATEAAAAKGIQLVVVKHTGAKKGFVLLPRRWVVERTFGWLSQCRALARDYEFHPETSEALIQVAMIHLMLRRLAKGGPLKACRC